ncbi:MAG: hypothetical protein HY765_02375 [Rhodomicrobium sp.]|nr:hypothetical protein [Rhodomicrobium sp.]
MAAAGLAERASATERVDIALKAEANGPESDSAGQKPLNPLEFAKAMKERAVKRAGDAAAAIAPARDAVQAKVKEVREAAIGIRKAEIALENAEDRAEAAARRFQKSSEFEDVLAALDAKAEAEAKVGEAREALAAAQRAKAEKEQDEAAAVKAYKHAESVKEAAAGAVKAWNRRLAPLSVFVSRKAQRLYVRQGFIKVFDVPVAIRDPEKPLGTHLYMAMQPDQNTGLGAPALRWLALTIPEASTDGEPLRRRHRRRHSYDSHEEDAPRAAPPVSASEALDRIELPAEVQGKISEMLWAGGSLIVSDSGLSRETGDGTDFIILTR